MNIKKIQTASQIRHRYRRMLEILHAVRRSYRSKRYEVLLEDRIAIERAADFTIALMGYYREGGGAVGMLRIIEYLGDPMCDISCELGNYLLGYIEQALRWDNESEEQELEYRKDFLVSLHNLSYSEMFPPKVIDRHVRSLIWGVSALLPYALKNREGFQFFGYHEDWDSKLFSLEQRN